jgi:hypothetical protein
VNVGRSENAEISVRATQPTSIEAKYKTEDIEYGYERQDGAVVGRAVR